jgi:Zn-dependent M28 family amino/carboxypeptidase
LEAFVRGKAALLTCVIAAAMVVPVSTATAAVDDVNTTKLRQAVTVNGILGHERALQRIANQNGGTRAAGTPGYAKSVDYVTSTLRQAGYSVRKQVFDFPFYQEVGPSTLTLTGQPNVVIESSTLEYSGDGDVTGTLVPAINNVIPATPTPSSSAGCLPSDFIPASATEPQVALIQRGTCTFEEKVNNAVAAGYDAVVVFNEGQPGRDALLTGVTIGAIVPIPVVGISYADGVALTAAATPGPASVTVHTDTFSEIRPTTNVIADSKKGDPNKVVVVGAHLDSVLDGPGINDNGSGTAVNLETAVQIAKLKLVPTQKLRFAFWGAEEAGLLGSEHYVENLSDVELRKIYANLNFDMLGSPNYVRFVYDGDGSSEGVAGPPGSAQIEQIFNGYFEGQGLATEPTAFDGRSDYGPFIAAGIPAGGLFSGAEDIKTAEEAAVYGGTAGAPYDSCYHQGCDDITNLSTQALYELGDAAVHATWTLAKSKGGLFEDNSRMAARQAISADQFDYRGSHLIR